MLARQAPNRAKKVLTVAALLVAVQLAFEGTFFFALGADAETSAASTPDGPRWQYVGIRKCRLCHDRRPQEKGEPVLDDDSGLTDFVSLTEFRT